MVDDLAPPRQRADAARNRSTLIDTARAVFTEHGGDASLEQIARAAGVGIGTVYRHFPNRLDLLEAVYRDEVDVLIKAVGRESALMTHSRSVIYDTAEHLVAATQAAGQVRADVASPDVLRLVGGCTMMPDFDREQTERILRVVMDGLRTGR